MKILKISLFVVLVLVAVLIAVGAALPDSSHVERSVVIDVPPEQVFKLANTIKKFNQWSPWYPIDPDTEYTFSGPDEGVGASMAWHSDNKQVGSGRQTITQSQPNELIKVELDFGTMGIADASYQLTAEGAGTHFVWAFDVEHGGSLINRYFGLMMDKWVGADYETGLAKLKQVAETNYQ